MKENKILIISQILYILAAACFIGYLITKESGLMACGGLLMIGGAFALIRGKKDK